MLRIAGTPCATMLAATAGAMWLLLSPASGVPSQPPAGSEALGRVIDEVVTEGPACAGLAIGVEQRNMRVQRFYGDTGRHGRPNADSEFEIGSITKTLTATVLAYEDQQGAIRMNDPLAHFAPAGMRVPDFYGQQILMLHLATHTSGLPRGVPVFNPPLMPEAMWRFVSSYQLQRPPGAQFLYSNLGFALLARAISRRETLTEDQLYARIITQPLGMHDTAISLSSAQRVRLAQGYGADGQPVREGAPGFPAMAGAGAAHSTLNDMMRYLDFQLGRLSVPLTSLLPVLHQPRHAAGPNGRVGLGWQMNQQPVEVISKGGATRGFSSFIVFAPASRSGVVILSNQARCPVAKMGFRIIAILNGSNVNAPELPAAGDEN